MPEIELYNSFNLRNSPKFVISFFIHQRNRRSTYHGTDNFSSDASEGVVSEFPIDNLGNNLSSTSVTSFRVINPMYQNIHSGFYSPKWGR